MALPIDQESNIEYRLSEAYALASSVRDPVYVMPKAWLRFKKRSDPNQA